MVTTSLSTVIGGVITAVFFGVTTIANPSANPPWTTADLTPTPDSPPVSDQVLESEKAEDLATLLEESSASNPITNPITASKQTLNCPEDQQVIYMPTCVDPATNIPLNTTWIDETTDPYRESTVYSGNEQLSGTIILAPMYVDDESLHIRLNEESLTKLPYSLQEWFSKKGISRFDVRNQESSKIQEYLESNVGKEITFAANRIGTRMEGTPFMNISEILP